MNTDLVSKGKILASEISQWFNKYLIQKLSSNLKGSSVQNNLDFFNLPLGHPRDKLCPSQGGWPPGFPSVALISLCEKSGLTVFSKQNSLSEMQIHTLISNPGEDSAHQFACFKARHRVATYQVMTFFRCIGS